MKTLDNIITKREKEILNLIAFEFNTKEIASNSPLVKKL
jgi:DNA-binding CsgD family transcriptional regulator